MRRRRPAFRGGAARRNGSMPSCRPRRRCRRCLRLLRQRYPGGREPSAPRHRCHRRRPVRPIALNFYAHVDGGIKQQTSHSHRCRVYISQSRIRNLNEIWFLASSTTEERRVLAKPRWRSTSGRAYPTVSLSIKTCAYFDSVQLYIVAEFPPGIRRTSLQCVLNAIDKT